MNNKDQIDLLREKVRKLEHDESLLFEILINKNFFKINLNKCVNTIINISTYILRYNNAITFLEDNPNSIIDLKKIE